MSTGSKGASVGSQVELLSARLGWPLTTGEPQRQVITEAEDRIDRAGWLDAAKRQLGPFGELFAEEATNERLVEIELVDVHACHG